jgi:hypothetical protein
MTAAKPLGESPAQTLLALLTDPKTAALSDRALGRRCGLHGQVVAGFRLGLCVVRVGLEGQAEVHAVVGGAQHQVIPNAAPQAAGKPVRVTSTRRHTPDIEALRLNALDCWFNATEAERRRYVSNVGLNHLFLAAPSDQREALVRRHLNERRQPEQRAERAASGLIGNDPGEIPAALRR